MKGMVDMEIMVMMHIRRIMDDMITMLMVTISMVGMDIEEVIISIYHSFLLYIWHQLIPISKKKLSTKLINIGLFQ